MIKGTYLEQKIERSVYNKRKRKIFSSIEQIREYISLKFSHLSNTYIVDSAPIEICKLARIKRSHIYSTDTIGAAFDYCTSKQHQYFDHKLHLLCDENAIIHSFDLILANIHDINYLKNIKYQINNCELIARNEAI